MNPFDKPTVSISFFTTQTGSLGFDVEVEEANLPEWEWAAFSWPLAIGENWQRCWIDLLKEIGETHGTDPNDTDTDDDGLTDCDDGTYSGTDEYCHEIDYDCDGESDGGEGCTHTPNQWDRCPLNCDIDMPF